MALHDNPKSCAYCGTLCGGSQVMCGNCRNPLPEREAEPLKKIEFQGARVGTQTARGDCYLATRSLYFGGNWSDWTVSLTKLEIPLKELKLMVANIQKAEKQGVDE